MEYVLMLLGYVPLGIALLTLGAFFAFGKMDSLWGCILKFCNMVFAYLIALNYFEPVANLLEGYMVVVAYYLDTYCFALLFLITLLVLELICKSLSPVDPQYEQTFGASVKYPLIGVTGCGMIFLLTFMTILTPGRPLKTEPPSSASVFRFRPCYAVTTYVSKGALKPFTGNADAFSITDLGKRNYYRQCAVYAAVIKDGDWRCSASSSPNAGAEN